MNKWLKGSRADGKLIVPLGAALCALILGLAPHVLHFPVWVSALALSCSAFRFFAERRCWRLPAPLLRMAVVLFAFVWVIAAFRGINGIVPGSALLAVMAGLKLLESTGKRDLHIIVVVAAFLMLAGTLRTQSIAMLPYLCLAAPALIVAWIAVARTNKPLTFKALLSHAKLIILPALPLVAVFFVLFPRVQGSFWALPTDSGATTGLSDSLTPGDISKLVSSDEIAFRVSFEDRAPAAPSLYWRGPVLEFFRDRSWQQRPSERQAFNAPMKAATADMIRYRLIQQPTGQRWVFGLEVTDVVNQPNVRITGSGTLLNLRPINKLYPVVLAASIDKRRTERLTEARRRFLIDFDANANSRSQALAKSLRQSSSTTAEFAANALALFRDNDFAYTLEPPALGRNSVDEFLFESKRGFCAHYASAFAFLMRAGKVPARLVVGYQGGTENPLTGQYVVRQSDAHAWVEIWNDADEWQRVDPTAEVAALRIISGLDAALEATGERRSLFAWDVPLAERFQLAWDALNARWDEWILGYGPDTQQAFLRWLGLGDTNWSTLALWLIAGTIIVMGAIAWRINRRFRKAPIDRTERRYQELLKVVADRVTPSTSPLQVKVILKERFPPLAAQIDHVIDQYQALRFAERGNFSDFDQAAMALRSQLRQAHVTTTTPPQ